MITVASETLRELPASPIVFGAFAFGIFVVLLYLVLRLDK
jgi:ABC-type phosphate transport system permease subunit